MPRDSPKQHPLAWLLAVPLTSIRARIGQSTLIKTSLASGLTYVYAKKAGAPWWTDAYFLTAIDEHNGETRFSRLAGTGLSHDNNWGTTAIGPDSCVYVGLLRGIARFCDGADQQAAQRHMHSTGL